LQEEYRIEINNFAIFDRSLSYINTNYDINIKQGS